MFFKQSPFRSPQNQKGRKADGDEYRDFDPDATGSALERMAPPELFRHLFHRAPVHARISVYVLDEPLQHQEYLRAARDVRMNSQWKYRPFVFAVYPVELIAPQLFDVTRVDEAVAVG
jgi:hypothetical protein